MEIEERNSRKLERPASSACGTERRSVRLRDPASQGGGAATAMVGDPYATVLLADSTAYGWLPTASLEGGDMVTRPKCFASIVCGGSLVKPGRKPVTILDQFMSDWILTGGVEAANPHMEVGLAIIPAGDSVPGRQYQALEAARAGYGIREAGPSIMRMAGPAYGQGRKALHFLRAEADAAMEAVLVAAVAAAAAGVAERRSASSARASAAEGRSVADPWIAVVVCAGWNCNEHENLAEAFLLKEMQAAGDWGELVQVWSAHSKHRLPWARVAPRLPPVPAVLLQTNREDHEGSRENMQAFASQLERHFVPDDACQQDLQQLGGAPLLARSASFQRGSHRADLWRYARLHRTGGNYLDIKMALLQPLADTLTAVYAEADESLMGQSVAQSHGVRSVRDVPHIILSIGANRRHVYQGNILQCPARHPLITRALSDAMRTTPAQLVRTYLRFCQYLWSELTADLGHAPVHGWNWTPTFGPVYLFQEVLLPKPERKEVRTVKGDVVPIDGHVMTLAGPGNPQYAATRAWGWKHGFLELQLTASAAAAEATRQAAADAAANQSVAQVEASGSASSAGPGVASAATDQSVAQVAEAADASPASSEKEISPDPGGIGASPCRTQGRLVHLPPLQKQPKAGEVVEATVTAMENMDEAGREVGVWAPVDVATRLAAEQATLPTASSPPNFLEEIRRPAGAAADFFQLLAKTLQPSVAGNRRLLARALVAVHPLPPFLQSVAQQRTRWGTSWHDLTAPANVRWAVHDDGPEEPYHGLVMVRGEDWDEVKKPSLYSTLLAQLVFSACDSQLRELPAAELQSGREAAVCIQFNEASRAEGQAARLLLTAKGERPWKFDLDPRDIQRQYGGKSWKPTRVQAATGEAVGRSRRVLQKRG
eukprot:s3156_g9.t1